MSGSGRPEMDPARWRRINDIFQDTIEHAAKARQAFLIDLCAGDAGLREEVERLVRAHEHAAGFLARPALASDRQMLWLDDPSGPVVRPHGTSQVEAEFRGTGRFTVLRRLGAGGMGVVYAVHDGVRHEAIALKTLRRAQPADVFRLKREFRSLADISHPNVVCLYELVVEAEHCFFTMELVNGLGVPEYVRPFVADAGLTGAEGQRADAGLVRSVLRQLVAGVSALHEHGKLHRDIKPSNIMVRPDGRVVILDFGLMSDALPSTPEPDEPMAGTPAYLAPEQHAGGHPSEATDWYAVGVTLYEVLTGRLPFEGSSHELRSRQRHGDPPAPRSIEPQVPNDLNEICVGLLCRDPQRRLSGRNALDKLVDNAPRQPETRGRERRQKPLFVGRAQQLAILTASFAAVREGRAATVCIHGPSGIGKTALVQQFLDQVAHGDDAVVLRGRCYEHESVPYKALDGVIDSLSQHLGYLPRTEAQTLVPSDVRALSRLFPVMLRVESVATAPRLEPEIPDPLVLRRRAFSSLRELLTRMADRRPLVLYIDDLHWADADSVLLLEELLRPPEPPSLLLLACFRREEIASKLFLQKLLERAGADSAMALPLEPLTEDEACALIASLIPVDSPVSQAERLTIVREAHGIPFLLDQLARSVVIDETGRARGATFVEMLDGRVSALPPEAQRFLETLAICGRPVSPDLVYEAAGLAGDERPLVAFLRTDRFLRSSGSAQRIEIYHDRIREVLVARVSPDDERRIHGLMVRTLLARRAEDPEALYAHYRGAGDHAGASTQAALAARKAVAALAFDRAASFYRCALELAPDSPVRFEWKQGLAGALANAGRPTEAADVYLDAAGGADPARRVEFQRRAAEQMLIGGHIDRGLDIARAVLREVGIRLATTPQMALASYLVRRAQLRWRGLEFVRRDVDRIAAEVLLRIDTCWSVTTGLTLVDSIRAADFHTRHLLLALDAGDTYRIARGIALEVGFSAAIGGPNVQRTVELIERAHAMAERVGHPHAIALATLAEGMAAYLVGQWSKATLLCDRALVILRDQCVGVTWELNCAQNFLLGSLLYEGKLHEVSRQLPILLASAREHGNRYFETELRTRMTLVWLAADHPAEGEQQADDVMERWSHEGFHRQHYNHVLARVQTELYRGRAQPAWQLIEENWAAIKRSHLLRVQWARIEAAYVRGRCALLMAAHGRDARRFLSVARDEVRRIEREKMPWSDPLGLLMSAAVAYLEGDAQGAERRLVCAVDGFDRAKMKLYAAAARRRLGTLMNDDGGRELVRQAEDWMASQDIKEPILMTQLIAPGFLEGPGTLR